MRQALDNPRTDLLGRVQALRPDSDQGARGQDGRPSPMRGAAGPGGVDVTTWTVLTVPGWQALFAGVSYLAEPADARRVVAIDAWRPVDGPEVLLGAHAAPAVWDRLAAAHNVRHYETENQLDPSSPWRGPVAQLRHSLDRARHPLIPWNYSAVNAEFWGDEVRPLRPRPALPPTPRDLVRRPVDVLMYGCANPRREAVARQCRERGLVVQTVGWGAPLFGDALVAAEKQAKIVLNVHYYMPGIFEAFRCIPAVSRGALVVSEESEGHEGHDLVFAGAPYEHLANKCHEIITLFRDISECDYSV